MRKHPRAAFKNLPIALSTSASAITTPASVFAQSPNQVTLKFDDGHGVTGEVISYANGAFELSTTVGAVLIPG